MKNFSTQKERILQFIDYKGISKNKFYIDTGISNGTLDKKSGLSMETIEKLYSTYPEINPEWLLTGKGEMLKSNNSGGNIHAAGDMIASNNSTITVNKVLSMEERVQQENLKLQYEIKMRDREIEILERDITSYKEALEQQKYSQELIKELYERKVEDLKRTINILETRMEGGNKN